ncbi:LPS-assembly protein LptD [Corallococcus sp. AB049A]|uniref:LPS-assembly protein LptD n=1 Tax=Corallococcus sp. AB049A TaxID=2316721 RepID=UPI000EA3EA34|nr:LPS assembly protein LptD [Corallococcus sp. AB049A]RKH48000.1 LPS-assembly protein LptD [Corallococcus sp. AB050B]RKI51047.1 LPS-assembly protein LptD [Corallococcus sp. AB049A]
MTFLAPVVLTLWVSAQIPLATQVELPTGEVVELAADYVVYENDVLTARGHCELRSGPNVLRADEVTYSEATQVATATGNVMFVSGLMAAIADDVRVDLRSNEANVKGGLFMQKKGVTPEALQAAKTPDELRKLGETPVLMSGTRIRRTGETAFSVDGLAFTPCQCGPGEPSWRVEAKEANVKMGERAILTWPVVYVRSVPVFALPWLYLPLAERRSGLLIPRPSNSGLNGFALDVPVFVTLGESYDLTFTPGIYTGGGDVVNAHFTSREGVEIREPRPNGVKGPRLLTEFRYVPSDRTRGRATLGFLYDLRPRLNPVSLDFMRVYREIDAEGNRDYTSEIVDEKRGLRGEASWQHTQELGDGWHDRVDAYFVSDGYYTRDLTADLLVQNYNYLRSTAVVYQRRDDRYLGLDVSLRQDLRYPFRFFQTNTIPAEATKENVTKEPHGPTTFQRLPGITLALPQRPLFGGRVMGGMQVEYSRLAPLRSGGFADDGSDGLFSLAGKWRPEGTPLATVVDDLPVDELEGNGRLDPSEREGRDRVSLAPQLSTSYGLGNWARLTPSLGLRQDVSVGEVSGRTAARGYALADLMLDSQLARTFTDGDTLYRHTLSPSVALRYVPGGWGHGLTALNSSGTGTVPLIYDEWDAAVPLQSDGSVRGFLHAVVAVDNTLRVRKGPTTREPLRLRIGQGFDLSRVAPVSGRDTVQGSVLRDTFARLSASAGVITAGGLVRMDPTTLDITQLSADFTIDNGKGNALYARYDDLLAVKQMSIDRGFDPLAQGPDFVRRGTDMLVGDAPRPLPSHTDQVDPSPTERAQALTVGTRIKLGFGLGLRYEALVQPLYKDSNTLESQPLAQQTFGVSYGPACDCWRIEGVVILRRNQTPEFAGVNLSVAGFGSFGSGG